MLLGLLTRSLVGSLVCFLLGLLDGFLVGSLVGLLVGFPADLLVGLLQLGRIRVMRPTPSICAQTFLLSPFPHNTQLAHLDFTVYRDYFNSSDLTVQSWIHLGRRSAVCPIRGIRTDSTDDFRRSFVPESSAGYLIGYLGAQERGQQRPLRLSSCWGEACSRTNAGVEYAAIWARAIGVGDPL